MMPELSPWLLSDETGEPFRHCVHCRMPLDEIDAPWLVNKEYRHGECVLEYAICQPCREAAAAEIPDACKQAVRAFLEHEIDWQARADEIGRDGSVGNHLAACIRCHAPRESLAGFSLSAQFDASGRLVEGPLPLILCDDCTARLRGLLSPVTLDIWKRFVAGHFATPPDPEDPHASGPPGSR